MKKSYYIVAVGIFLVIIGFVLFIFLSKKSSAPGNLQPPINPNDIPIGDISKIPGAEQLSPNDTLVKNTLDYNIIYFNPSSTNKSFLITINSSNIEESRQKAESAFLQSIGITQEQACLLTVSLRVSSDVNKYLAGQEFGLSFCPNGKPFPTK